jgi:hypothetical protein
VIRELFIMLRVSLFHNTNNREMDQQKRVMCLKYQLLSIEKKRKNAEEKRYFNDKRYTEN